MIFTFRLALMQLQHVYEMLIRVCIPRRKLAFTRTFQLILNCHFSLHCEWIILIVLLPKACLYTGQQPVFAEKNAENITRGAIWQTRDCSWDADFTVAPGYGSFNAERVNIYKLQCRG